MVKLESKVEAFTIMESMVAMIIVIIVFSLSSMVILHVSSSGISREKQNAYMLVKKIHNETIRQNRWISETIELDDFMIEKTISDYGRSTELKEFSITASKNSKKMYELKDLILLKELAP